MDWARHAPSALGGSRGGFAPSPTRLEQLLSRLERSEATADRSIAATGAFVARNAEALVAAEPPMAAAERFLASQRARATEEAEAEEAAGKENAADGTAALFSSSSAVRARVPAAGGRSVEGVAEGSPTGSSKYAALRSVLNDHIAGLTASLDD